MTTLPKTGERLIPGNFKSKDEYFMYLRHLFVYKFAEKIFSPDYFVLEVGCGEGYGASILSRHVRQIVALDVDEKTISHASGKYKSSNCSFNLYDGLTLPFDDNACDAAISFQVIEHVKDDINFISEIHRILKPGGICLLTTPNAIHRIPKGQKPWNRFHVREYYPEEMTQILKNQFSDVEIYGICSDEMMQKKELKRISRARIYSRIISVFPERVRMSVRSLAKSIIHKKESQSKNVDYSSRFGLERFFLTKDSPGDGLDLLGVCKK